VKPIGGIKQFVFRYHTATSHFTLWSRCCSCNPAVQQPSNLATVLAQSLGSPALKGSASGLCPTLECTGLHTLVEYRISNGQSEPLDSESAPAVRVGGTFAVINLFQ